MADQSLPATVHELRVLLSQALDALAVSAPPTAPEHVEAPGAGSTVAGKKSLEGSSVLWWHTLPVPTTDVPMSTPLGVLTTDGDGAGAVYMTQSWIRGVEYWPDITALTTDQARRLGHALIAAARHADRTPEFVESVVTAFRRTQPGPSGPEPLRG